MPRLIVIFSVSPGLVQISSNVIFDFSISLPSYYHLYGWYLRRPDRKIKGCGANHFVARVADRLSRRIQRRNGPNSALADQSFRDYIDNVDIDEHDSQQQSEPPEQSVVLATPAQSASGHCDRLVRR